MKKFTDSEKWRDPWFRSLSVESKTLWIFLLDEVDNAGIWEIDQSYFKYASGVKKDLENLLSTLGDRVVFLPDKRHLLIPKYCFYQQGGFLTENKPAHRRIFQLLQRHELQQDEKGNLYHSNGMAMPSVCHSNGINIGIGIGIGNKERDKGSGEKGKRIPNDPPESLKDDLSFLAVWDEWKAYRKERGLRPYKPMGLKALHTQLTKWAKTHGAPALIQSIRDSMANDYKGLFEPKLTKNQPDPNTIVYDEHAFDLSRH